VEKVEKVENNSSPPSVLVIIAALNEEEGIGPSLAELKEVLDDPMYLVVDGNSTDKTVQVAKEMGAEVVVQKGRGKGRAIAQALNYVGSDSRYVVFTDADYTYPAEYIPKMVEILEGNPDVGMVTGDRFDKRFVLKKAMSNTFYFGNRFLAFMHYMLNGVKLRDPLTGLRIVRGEVLKGWKPRSWGFDVEAELNYYVERKGYRIMEIPIYYRGRLGEKKLKLRHGFTILRRILLESFNHF
jgi:dolichol-phosphate mannosyltransferase